jgi:hypothetical protein
MSLPQPPIHLALFSQSTGPAGDNPGLSAINYSDWVLTVHRKVAYRMTRISAVMVRRINHKNIRIPDISQI